MRRGNREHNRGIAHRQSSRSHQGFSLVEVLVTMAILVIGILAVARLFPYGFLSIQRTANISKAQAMSAQILSAYQTPAQYIDAGLPDANGQIIDVPGIQPDNLNPATGTELASLQSTLGFTLPSGFPLYAFSNVNRIKYVHGETFTVPAANPAVHLLQLGPVYNVFNTLANVPSDSLVVHGSNLTPVAESSSPTTDDPSAYPTLSSPDSYAIDYARGAIAFYPRITNPGYAVPYRTFIMTYQGYSSGATAPSAITLQIQVPDAPVPQAGQIVEPKWMAINGSNTTVISPPGLANGALPGIFPGSDQVSRMFRLVSTSPGVNQPFSSDPYEYGWLTPQETGNANVGSLIFNPLGRTAADVNGSGLVAQKPLQVFVDYLIFDNHILRDDRSFPASRPYDLQLSVSGIDQVGDPMTDQTTYDGLYHDIPGDTTLDEADLVIVNRHTGLPMYYANNGTIYTYNVANPYSPGTDLPVGTVDAKNGILTFQQTYIEANNLEGLPLRVLYRAHRAWGVQLQQAAAQYTPAATGAVPSSTTYYIGGGAMGGSASRIYFSPSEEGKTVTLTDVYYATNLPGFIANDPTTYGHSYQVTAQVGQLIQQVGGYPMVYIDISTVIPNATTLSAFPTGLSVRSIEGNSVKARVIWHDNLTPGQEVFWHKVDEDEFRSGGALTMIGGSQ